MARAVAATVFALALGSAPGIAQAAPDPGGDASAAIPVPPADGKLFGLNGGIGSHGHLNEEDLANVTAAAGGNTIRAVLNWQSVEPQRGRWSDATWGEYDRLYAASVTRGLTPIFVLGNAPWWARTLIGKLCLSNHYCANPPRPTMDGEWGEFAAEAARRYPQAIFEIWNEPNLRSYWLEGPDPKRYAKLQVVAYDAIKAVNPDATVLTAGLANVSRSALLAGLLDGILGRMDMGEFLQRAYNAPVSIKGHFDGIAFHPYPGPPPASYADEPPSLGAGSVFASGFAAIRRVRDESGDSHIPLYVTETGISTTEGVNRAQQAPATMRIYRKALSMDDVKAVVFHRIHEPAGISLSAYQAGLAWVDRAAFPPRPYPVFCEFAGAAGNAYPGC